jgi:predicted nucleic acid-binding protein
LKQSHKRRGRRLGNAEISPDPGDNCFCACSEEGTADFLVTLNLKDFHPQIVMLDVSRNFC